MEFEKRFATEEACHEYLYQFRWPNGYQCPQCTHQKAWFTERKLYHCAKCGYETSITEGTIFQDTSKPLSVWFRAMWYITNQKHGISALGLQRALGLGSYRTAWTWLHKLRCAMVRPGRDQLSGSIEVDRNLFWRPKTRKARPWGYRKNLGTCCWLRKRGNASDEYVLNESQMPLEVSLCSGLF